MIGNIRFTATEDLGGGLKASASIQFGVTGRAADGTANVSTATSATNNVSPSDGTPTVATTSSASRVAQEDATITLSGGFGAVTMGSIEAGNGIVGLGGAGAPVRGLNNSYSAATSSLLIGAANVDLLQYTSPSFNGATVRVLMVDSVGAPGAGGQNSTATTAKGTVVGVRYAAGPLTADVDYTSNSRNSATGAQTTKRTRMSASYDLGVARVGAGMEKRKRAASAGAATTTATDTIIGVSAPVASNITVGLTHGTADNHKGTAGSKKGSGTEFGIKYDLSKRTSLTAQTGSFKASTADANQGKQSITRVRLDHSF